MYLYVLLSQKRLSPTLIFDSVNNPGSIVNHSWQQPSITQVGSSQQAHCYAKFYPTRMYNSIKKLPTNVNVVKVKLDILMAPSLINKSSKFQSHSKKNCFVDFYS